MCSKTQENFEKLNKQLEKVIRVAESEKAPRLYLRGLIVLEDYLAQTLANKDAKKKMSPSNVKALNAMKQKLKKTCKQYENEISEERKKPEEEEEEEEESEESEEEEESEDEVSGEEQESKKLPEAGGEELTSGWETQKSRKERGFDRQFQKEPSEITWEMVNSKLKEIIAARGRKGTDRNEQVEQLQYLTRVAKTPAQKLEVILQVNSAEGLWGRG